jgi:hypothetical protein
VRLKLFPTLASSLSPPYLSPTTGLTPSLSFFLSHLSALAYAGGHGGAWRSLRRTAAAAAQAREARPPARVAGPPSGGGVVGGRPGAAGPPSGDSRSTDSFFSFVVNEIDVV